MKSRDDMIIRAIDRYEKMSDKLDREMTAVFMMSERHGHGRAAASPDYQERLGNADRLARKMASLRERVEYLASGPEGA